MARKPTDRKTHSHSGDNGHSPNRSHSLVNRRTFLAATGASFALAGCIGDSGSGNGSGDFEGETLRVTTWGADYAEAFRETFKEPYEEETGGTLEVIGRWDDILADIRSSPEDDPPYDVTILDNFYYWIAKEEGLVQELRAENVPNMDEVYPHLEEFVGFDYGVTVDADPAVLIYKNDMDWEPSTWADLHNENAQNISLEGGWYVYSVILAAIAIDEGTNGKIIYDESNHDRIFEALREMDVVQWYTGAQQLWSSMDQGVVDIAQYYYGLGKPTVEEDDSLSMTVPDVTTGYTDQYGVVRGSDQRDMGEHFINFMLSQEMQTAWAENFNTGIVNQNAEYPEDIRDELPSSNEAYEQITFPDFSRLSEYSDELTSRWEEVKSS